MTMYSHLHSHLHLRALRRCFLSKATYSNSYIMFIHWWRWLSCKVPTSTSGAVFQGSVSCPRTLRHADQGNQTTPPIHTSTLKDSLYAITAHAAKGVMLSPVSICWLVGLSAGSRKSRWTDFHETRMEETPLSFGADPENYFFPHFL